MAKYAIRSDVHGRIDLSNKQINEVIQNQYTGLFDLGDIEFSHIGKDHPLRQNQKPNQDTMDIIVENALKDNRKLGEQVIKNTLYSGREMLDHLKNIKINYKGISGNGSEAWMKIFEAIATDKEQEELEKLLEDYQTILKTEPGVEFYKNGELYLPKNNDDYVDSALIYLPWKSDKVRLNEELSKLDDVHLDKIVVLSHDYLSIDSIPETYKNSIKPMKNEEQAKIVLDKITEIDAKEREVYFGHIGFEYEAFEKEFKYNGKNIKAYHTDEKILPH